MSPRIFQLIKFLRISLIRSFQADFLSDTGLLQSSPVDMLLKTISSFTKEIHKKKKRKKKITKLQFN